MKQETKLYNLLFPIWFLIFIPITWLIVIPGNFIIDSIVLLLTLKVLKISDIKGVYKKVIIKLWIVGFVADFIGCGVMMLGAYGIFGSDKFDAISSSLSWNPFNNVVALLWTVLGIIVAGVFIYLLNLKVSLKNADIEESQKKKIALSVAIFTAPYLLLLPTQLLY